MGKNKKGEKGGVPFFVILLLVGSVVLVPVYIVYRMFVRLSEAEDLEAHTQVDPVGSTSKEVGSGIKEEEPMVVLKKGAVSKSTPVVKPVKKKEAKLSARQEEILSFITSNTEVDTSILHAKFKNVTVRTLRRDLKVLTGLGLVEKQGETKGATYKKI